MPIVGKNFGRIKMKRPIRDWVMRMISGPDWKQKRQKKIEEREELAKKRILAEKEAKKRQQDMDLNAVLKKE